MRMRWLQLSDLHFNYKGYKSSVLRDDFISRVRILSAQNAFTHLFLTGDLLYRNASDADDTVEFISKLVQAMGITLKDVYIVPGNHDHDRDVTDPITQILYENEDKVDERIANVSLEQQRELLGSFANYFEIYQRIMGESYYESLDNPHLAKYYGDHGVMVARLNTAWLETRSEAVAVLRCGPTQLYSQIQKALTDLKPNSVSIAIGHHPIDVMSQSEMSAILDLFRRTKIGLYLCGHSHKSSVRYFEDADVLQLTCAGAYHDGYSMGGYIVGVMDNRSTFYKAEFYEWNDGQWRIESNLEGTSGNGTYCFSTGAYQHNPDIVVFDLDAYGGPIPPQTLENAIGARQYDLHRLPTQPNDGTHIEWTSKRQVYDAMAQKALDLSCKSIHVFPKAPIPLLLAFGKKLQKNTTITIHQYDRDNDMWIATPTGVVAPQFMSKEEKNQSTKLIVIISMSTRIARSQIDGLLKMDEYDLVEFSTDQTQPGFPLYPNHVTALIDFIFRKNLDRIASSYSEIQLFASVPAGVAIEIGRNLQNGIYPKVYTYNYYQGYHAAIEL